MTPTSLLGWGMTGQHESCRVDYMDWMAKYQRCGCGCHPVVGENRAAEVAEVSNFAPTVAAARPKRATRVVFTTSVGTRVLSTDDMAAVAALELVITVEEHRERLGPGLPPETVAGPRPEPARQLDDQGRWDRSLRQGPAHRRGELLGITVPGQVRGREREVPVLHTGRV